MELNMRLSTKLKSWVRYDSLLESAKREVSKGGYGYTWGRIEGKDGLKPILYTGDPAFNQVGHILNQDQADWLKSNGFPEV